MSGTNLMRYFGATLSDPVSMANVLRRGLELFPDELALATMDGELTWRELDRLSTLYANNLLKVLEPGDRVASFLPNSTKLFLNYLGIMKAGLVTVPLNYRYTHFEIDHALKVSEARALVYDKHRAGEIAASERAALLDHRFEVDPDHPTGGDAFSELFQDGTDSGPPPPPAADAPLAIFFTSGSTGPAKGVTHTHDTLGWMAASAAKSYQLAPDDIFMAASSCSHIGGFLNVFASWSEGASVVVPRMGSPRTHLAMMRQQRPTIVLMLPAALFEVERSPDAVPSDFASLRLVGSGGDKVPEQLANEFSAKTGLPIDEIYGMTEIGLSHVNPSSGLVKFGSIGRVAAGYEAEVRDEARKPVPNGKEGRLWVRFPGTMAYYWNRPEATAEVYGEERWFDTGDVVRADKDGYFHFCGRRKQIIVHDGSNIFPQEVEDALLQHEAVKLVGVVGVHDVVHGENVRAFVTLRPGASPPSKLDLIAFAAERVGYKAPEDVVILDDMPLNPTGKVDRVRLKKLAEPGTA